MAKLTAISLLVEDLAVGKIMRLLHNTPGVAKINFALGTPKMKPNGAAFVRGPYKQNGAAPEHRPHKKRVMLEVTGEEAVIAAIAKAKRAFTIGELRDTFTSQGRSAKSISSVLHKMKTNGSLLKTADGYNLSKLVLNRLRKQKNKH